MLNKLRINYFIHRTLIYGHKQSLLKMKGVKQPYKNDLHAYYEKYNGWFRKTSNIKIILKIYKNI